MDLIKYKVFLSIVEKGSYSKVSEEFGYTQSGISKMMNSMENEIGFPLIIRNNKGTSITREGKRLLPMIRQIVQDNELIEAEFNNLKGLETGRVKIGSFPTTAYAWIPEILKRFRNKHPGIDVEIMEDNNIFILEEWLEQGYVDMAIISEQEGLIYDWEPLIENSFVVVCNTDNPIANEGIISIERLAKENVALFKSHMSDDPDTALWMKYLPRDINAKYAGNSDFTMMRLVEENDIMVVVPMLFAEHAEKHYNVKICQLDIDASRKLGIAIRDKKRISPAARKFLECAKEVILGNEKR